MCEAVVEEKGWARLENPEPDWRTSGAGVQEAQRTLTEALVGWLWNSTAQVQSPASLLYSCVILSKLLPFSAPQVLHL